MEVCSDDLPDIVRSVRRFLHDLDLDYVVTSGGLGPTPDDRTMEGIAQALGAGMTCCAHKRFPMTVSSRARRAIGVSCLPESPPAAGS